MRESYESAFQALRPALTSAATLSAVAAGAGSIAAAAGVVSYLLVEEIRSFAAVVLVAGSLLLLIAAALSYRRAVRLLMGVRGRRWATSLALSAAFFIALSLVNLLVFRHPGRVDLTYTRVFTLAEQTVQTLETLNAPVRANAFFVPGESVQVQRQALDLLSEFQRRSESFTNRLIDPEVNAAAARYYDVSRYPAVVFEDLGTGARHPVTGFSEQELLTGLLIVTGERRKTVYYLSGHGERAEYGSPARDDGLDAALDGMRRDNYAVASLSIDQTGEVPRDTALVVIAGPRRDLSASDVDALERYVHSGGSLLAMFDPGVPDTFVDLFARWGLEIGRHPLADPISNVGGEVLSPLVRRSNGQLPAGMPITESLVEIFFPGAASIGALRSQAAAPPEGLIDLAPLAVTTSGSWQETDPAQPGFDPDEESRASFPVAVAVEASGTLDGSIRHAPARFVVFGDSDFASNRYLTSLDNSDLLLNSVNWLAADFDLISIRPRVFPSRELVVNRRERDFIKWSAWLLPPSLMLLMGACVWWRRR